MTNADTPWSLLCFILFVYAPCVISLCILYSLAWISCTSLATPHHVNRGCIFMGNKRDDLDQARDSDSEVSELCLAARSDR